MWYSLCFALCSKLKHHKEASDSEVILVIMDGRNDHIHDHNKQRWHKVKNLKDNLKDQLWTLSYPVRPRNGLSLAVESLILLCRTKHPDLQECNNCHVVHRSSENYRRHSPDYMPDKEEIEMRRLWHAGQLVEPRVKLIMLRAAQDNPGMSIDSGYYHWSQENPLPPLEEFRQVVVPLTRKEEEVVTQVTRADELEVLNQQVQAYLSHKQAQLDMAEQMNQNLQRQAVDQAAESERSKQAEIQQLQNVIIGLWEQVTESSKVVGVKDDLLQSQDDEIKRLRTQKTSAWRWVCSQCGSVLAKSRWLTLQLVIAGW
jgi:hypothetical protein